MDATQLVFIFASIVILGSAFAVVTVKNLVHAALSLIVTLFAVAILFAVLEAGFFAAVQVVLYIGAIAILIIFAVMLTRRVMQDSGPQTNNMFWVAALLAVVVFVGLASVIFGVNWPSEMTAVPAGNGSLEVLGKALVDPDQFAIPFEVASVLLIASMIGAIVVASDSKKKSSH